MNHLRWKVERARAEADRRRAEAALREREADLARVQRIGRVGGIDIDVANGLHSRRSPEYLRLHGLPPDTLEETHAQWRQRVHPEDRDRAEQTLFAALKSAAGTYENEYRIIRPDDGEVRWMQVRADIERDAEGRAVRLVGAHLDVTEHKHLQEELRKSEARLREADQRKNHFLAMLGHELRNPLAAIVSGLKLMASPKAKPESRERALPAVAEQTAHMERLIDDLLDVTRIVQGRLQVTREPMLLNEAVESALAMVRARAQAGDFTLQVTLPPGPLRILGDKVRLTQVFVNLLANAIKYSGSSRRIEVAVRQEDCWLVVSVRDHGIGIRPEFLPRVFEPFVQAAPGLTMAQGIGLGLAVARELVALHEGEVEASSAGEGQGSEFVVRLPAAPPL